MTRHRAGNLGQIALFDKGAAPKWAGAICPAIERPVPCRPRYAHVAAAVPRCPPPPAPEPGAGCQAPERERTDGASLGGRRLADSGVRCPPLAHVAALTPARPLNRRTDASLIRAGGPQRLEGGADLPDLDRAEVPAVEAEARIGCHDPDRA